MFVQLLSSLVNPRKKKQIIEFVFWLSLPLLESGLENPTQRKNGLLLLLIIIAERNLSSRPGEVLCWQTTWLKSSGVAFYGYAPRVVIPLAEELLLLLLYNQYRAGERLVWRL